MSDSSAPCPQWDTQNQVMWFICVQKEPSWEEKRFRHEFQVIHAEMARIGNEKSGLPLNYVQFGATELKDANNPTDENSDGAWDFITCLLWPSIAAIHMSFQNPEYRATAGKHIFCRLDQKGVLAKKSGALGATSERFVEQGNFAIHVFHNKNGKHDKKSAGWARERMRLVTEWSSPTSRSGPVKEYSVWTDIMPDDAEAFFKDTQFMGGSWHRFDAVERFVFQNSDEATNFWSEKRGLVLVNGDSTYVTGGSATVVI